VLNHILRILQIHPTEGMSNLKVSHDEVDSALTDDNLQKYFFYYFTKPIGGQKGKGMAKCRVCDQICPRNTGSTSSMTNHLKKLHTELWEKYDRAKKEIELKKQQRIAPDGSGNELFK
jgi:hypothetical protein